MSIKVSMDSVWFNTNKISPIVVNLEKYVDSSKSITTKDKEKILSDLKQISELVSRLSNLA